MELCNQALDDFVRRNQALGNCLILWRERRLCVEHDHPAQLSFERHKIEEQAVLLERKVVHGYGTSSDFSRRG